MNIIQSQLYNKNNILMIISADIARNAYFMLLMRRNVI